MCNLSAVIHTSLGVMYVLHDDKYTGSILELGTLTGSLGSSVVCQRNDLVAVVGCWQIFIFSLADQ